MIEITLDQIECRWDLCRWLQDEMQLKCSWNASDHFDRKCQNTRQQNDETTDRTHTKTNKTNQMNKIIKWDNKWFFSKSLIISSESSKTKNDQNIKQRWDHQKKTRTSEWKRMMIILDERKLFKLSRLVLESFSIQSLNHLSWHHSWYKQEKIAHLLSFLFYCMQSKHNLICCVYALIHSLFDELFPVFMREWADKKLKWKKETSSDVLQHEMTTIDNQLVEVWSHINQPTSSGLVISMFSSFQLLDETNLYIDESSS